jgi:short-subunit dehydrogenase
MPEKKTALITGATSGIGYELAKLFAGDGYQLVLVARDEEDLKRVADELADEHKVSVKVIAKDLSLAGSAQDIFDEVQRDRVNIDVLVNNAGFGMLGPFVRTDLQKELAMTQVHMVSLTHLTKLCLKGMLERREGKVLNVASTAAFQPGPLMAVYYASKAYVLSFSEAIANELRGSGVTVSVLCPGPTRTAFMRRAGMKPSKVFNRIAMDAASVAAAGYEGLMRGETVIVPGFMNKVFAFTVRVAPRGWVSSIIRRIQERRLKA